MWSSCPKRGDDVSDGLIRDEEAEICMLGAAAAAPLNHPDTGDSQDSLSSFTSVSCARCAWQRAQVMRPVDWAFVSRVSPRRRSISQGPERTRVNNRGVTPSK